MLDIWEMHVTKPIKMSTLLTTITITGIVLNKIKDPINAPSTKEVTISMVITIINLLLKFLFLAKLK